MLIHIVSVIARHGREVKGCYGPGVGVFLVLVLVLGKPLLCGWGVSMFMYRISYGRDVRKLSPVPPLLADFITECTTISLT